MVEQDARYTGNDKYSLRANFERAMEANARYVFVRLTTPTGMELVVIPNESAMQKLEFYESAYDNTLTHVMNKEVSITGLSYGDANRIPYII